MQYRQKDRKIRNRGYAVTTRGKWKVGQVTITILQSFCVKISKPKWREHIAKNQRQKGENTLYYQG